MQIVLQGDKGDIGQPGTDGPQGVPVRAFSIHECIYQSFYTKMFATCTVYFMTEMITVNLKETGY